MLDARWRAFRQLDPTDQAVIDSHRMVPTAELRDILCYYLMFGCCADEAVHSRPIGWVA